MALQTGTVTTATASHAADDSAIDSGATPAGINLGIGAVLVVLGTLVASAVPGHDGWARQAVLAAAVATAAALTVDQRVLLGVAVIAGLLDDGFLVDRLGVLSWHGAADLWRIFLIVGAGTAGLVAGETRRFLARRRFDAALRAFVQMEEKRDA